MDLEVVDIVLSKNYLFQGLPLSAMNFIRTKGLWMPVSKEILDISEAFKYETGQIYARHEVGDLLYLVIEQGEFLTASVHAVVDQDSQMSSSNFLHRYATEDGNTVLENIQHVVSGVMFLELLDEEGNVMFDWTNKDIDYIIRCSGN